MDIVLKADQFCPKCHKLDIDDPETRAEIMMCNRLADLEFIRCDCPTPFSLWATKLVVMVDCPCIDSTLPSEAMCNPCLRNKAVLCEFGHLCEHCKGEMRVRLATFNIGRTPNGTLFDKRTGELIVLESAEDANINR